MKKILVPISFSETSKNALQHAYSIAKKYGASLSLLHCYSSQEYNREYDFGKEDYNKGIRRMLETFYNQCIDDGNKHEYNLITFSGSVSDIVGKISAQYELLVISRKVGFQSKSNKYFSDKIYYISSQSLCPVLITPTNQQNFSFQKVRIIWHILRKEAEKDLVYNSLSRFQIDPELVVSKSLEQKKFISAFWKNLVSYTKSHDDALLTIIPQSFEEEHIDLLVTVNHLKGMFERFMKDDAFQIISQFDIPILILPAKK